jgi:hypothetical protein
LETSHLTACNELKTRLRERTHPEKPEMPFLLHLKVFLPVNITFGDIDVKSRNAK